MPGNAVNIYRKLWIAWSIGGLGSLAALLVAQELGYPLSARHWWWWAAFGLGSFAVLEVHGIIRKEGGDTFSELVWSMDDQRSIVIFACLWGVVALVVGNVWPSFPAFVLGWCAWHFWREGPYGSG